MDLIYSELEETIANMLQHDNSEFYRKKENFNVHKGTCLHTLWKLLMVEKGADQSYS